MLHLPDDSPCCLFGCFYSVGGVGAVSPTLQLTAALSPLAAEQGVDLTPLAQAEMAFNDMLASVRKFDGTYEAARERFYEAVGGNK